MKKLLKVKARYVNAIGYEVETTKMLSTSQLEELLSREDVLVLSVDGIPGSVYYRKVVSM